MAATMRLNKVLRELNISLDRAVEFLNSKGVEIEARPTTKISTEIYEVLSGEFQTDANKRVASKEVAEAKEKEKEALRAAREVEIEAKAEAKAAAPKKQEVVKAKAQLDGPKQVGKIDLSKGSGKPAPVKEEKKPEVKKEGVKKPEVSAAPVKEEVKPTPKPANNTLFNLGLPMEYLEVIARGMEAGPVLP